MRTQASFHRRGDTKRLMHAGEVVMHMEQRNHVNMVVDLFRERIGQSSKPAHIHSHVQVLPLDVAGRDVLRFRSTSHGLAKSAKTLRRAVAFLPFRIVAVDLVKLRIINSGSKSVIHGSQIHLVSVRGQLNPVRQAPGNVLKELRCVPGVPPSNKPAKYQLCFGVNRRERPNITRDLAFRNRRCQILLFAVAEAPNLIDLDALGWNVADNPILVLRAGRSDAFQQAEYSALGYAGHTNGGPHGAAFYQRCDDRDFFRHADNVRHKPIVRERFRISKRKVLSGAVLLCFLDLGPTGFRGLTCATSALFIGHGFHAPLAANLAAFGPHLAHHLLNQGKFCDFRSFQEYAPGILNGIKFGSCAFPLWHTPQAWH